MYTETNNWPIKFRVKASKPGGHDRLAASLISQRSLDEDLGRHGEDPIPIAVLANQAYLIILSGTEPHVHGL